MRGGVAVRAAVLGASVLAGAFALGAAGAQAQVSPFRAGPNAPRLAASDMDMVWRSAEALNTDPAARPGAARQWHNPKTRDSGTVTLQRIFEQNGLPCHDLRYAITVRTEAAPRRYDVTWCRTRAGAWKIAM